MGLLEAAHTMLKSPNCLSSCQIGGQLIPLAKSFRKEGLIENSFFGPLLKYFVSSGSAVCFVVKVGGVKIYKSIFYFVHHG